MDIVGRLFVGSERDRKLKNLTLDENEKIEKIKGGQKSMKIFPTPKEYRRKSILSIVTRLEENVETFEIENMTMLNCMTRIDETKSTEKLFVGDDAIGGTVQQRECRDDAVGGRVQQVDAKKLFVRTVKPEVCGDDAMGGMV